MIQSLLISSYCPAIVRLIQVKFPSLVQHLIKRKQPLDIAAIYYRKKLEDAGVEPNDIGIFYITPCAAKIAAIKSPVGEEHSSIDGVINMNFIFNKISWILKNNKNLDFSDIEASKIHHRSIRWPLTNGEIDRFEGRCLAIDEVHNAIEFLEKLENDEVTDIDFVEIRACDESCAGGILTVINRFIAVEGIKKRSKRQRESLMINPVENPILDEREYLHNKCIIHDIQPRSMMAIDEDINKAISKLEKGTAVDVLSAGNRLWNVRSTVMSISCRRYCSTQSANVVLCFRTNTNAKSWGFKSGKKCTVNAKNLG